LRAPSSRRALDALWFLCLPIGLSAIVLQTGCCLGPLLLLWLCPLSEGA